MTLALATTAIHGSLVTFGFPAALPVFAAAVFLALFHCGFHVFVFCHTCATGLAFLGFALVLAAACHCILRIA